MPNDLWAGWFGPENPFGKGAESAYFSNQNQWQTPNAKKYYQGQFSNIQDQYMGKLGQMVQQGGAPNLEFADFLSQFPWAQNYAGLTPQQRGQDTSQFNPFTKWLM